MILCNIDNIIKSAVKSRENGCWTGVTTPNLHHRKKHYIYNNKITFDEEMA